MAAVTICSDFGAQKIKSDTVSTVSPSISHEVMGPDTMILVFWMLSFKLTFSLSTFHFHQEAFSFLFTFCHKGGVICISEVIDICPGNLDSSLCFFQPSFSHDVLCIWASLVAQLVKNLPAMRETWVQSLGWEYTLKKGKATHSSTLSWRIT